MMMMLFIVLFQKQTVLSTAYLWGGYVLHLPGTDARTFTQTTTTVESLLQIVVAAAAALGFEDGEEVHSSTCVR